MKSEKQNEVRVFKKKMDVKRTAKKCTLSTY